MADENEARDHYGIELQPLEALAECDGVIVAVGHQVYREMGLSKVAGLCRDGVPMVLDVKAVFTPNEAVLLGTRYERL